MINIKKFDQTLITKYTDLKNNDSLSSYKTFSAQQNHNSFEVFHNLLANEKPSRVLEIGTALGGLTGFLDYTCKLLDINCKIISYDIHYNSWYEDLKKEGIDIRIENIFLNNYTSIPDEVAAYIQSAGVTLVLCDGGSKKDEFRVLSQYLKNNDIIIAHDYAPDSNYFEKYIKNKIWNWHEIQYSDIENSCKKYGLKPYMEQDFLNVAWACFKKYKLFL